MAPYFLILALLTAGFGARVPENKTAAIYDDDYDDVNDPEPDESGEAEPRADDCILTSLPPDPRTQCCGVDSLNTNRIFGGEQTSPEQYPWMVLIEYQSERTNRRIILCGGFLISGRYVVTAAHCVLGEILKFGKPISVRLGEYNITNKGPDCVKVPGGNNVCTHGEITIPIEKIGSHPKHFEDKHINIYDIALIRLKYDAPYTDFIRPICLPSSDVTLKPPDNITLYSAGWGSMAQTWVVELGKWTISNMYSDVKLHVDLPIKNIEECQKTYKFVNKTNICAGGVEGKDTCRGDSGGPLMYENDGIFEAVGLVSFGKLECGLAGNPAVYTNIYEFREWINGTILEHKKSLKESSPLPRMEENSSTADRVSNESKESACTTFSGGPGSCISLYDCQSLMTVINKPNKSQQDIEVLRKSQCGYQGNVPRVCCPTQTNDDSCFTPDGQQGRCMNIHSCQHLAALLKPPVDRETIAFVQNSRCEGQDQYSICCGPPRDIAPTTAPRPTGSCTLTSAPPDPRTRCCGVDSENGDKITGGNATAVDQYPWLVLIEYYKNNQIKLLCGGALISGRYVLTAGHCVVGQVLDVGTPRNVRLGEYDTAKNGQDCVESPGGGQDCTEGTTIIPIEKVIAHPDYNPTHYLRRNDIALLRLRQLAPYTDFIRPICLPTFDIAQSPTAGAVTLFAAGWGAINTTVSKSDVKQHVDLPYVSKQDCQRPYSLPRRNIPLWDGQVCAGGEVGKDSCKGDSGGPLMLEIERHFEVVGIVSFGPTPCGMEDVPGVYTKVYQYNPWIRSQIKP